MFFIHTAMLANTFAKWLLLFPGLCVLSSGAFAQIDCSGNQQLALMDFWFGEWRVEDESGEVLGRNNVYRLLNGCVIQERWQGIGGGVGISLFYVNPETNKLKQVWVTGQALSPGGTKEKELVAGELGRFVQFLGSYPNGDSRVLDRTTLTLQENGEIMQLIEISQDEGVTWQSAFRGLYQRR